MAIHYNAFISYKHAELDNRIAGTIEKDLERYHIPAKVRKKTGYKKIERIFRDTDELPITSDLSGTIEEALRNADYLIVLCSTNTCKSMWVEREIKLFLQTHSQDQILTVIADGEPADVIPKILQNREVVRINDRGEEETFIEPVEPLCCDYRLSKREAKRVELPRLVATLIGCSYNELMHRQRQYKMRRMTAIMSLVMAVAVGFGAYMLYSNRKINESYRQSLISQSKFLSNASGKLLDNERRIEAIQLALAALPNDENPDRPIVPEAEKAIASASLAYVTRSGSNISSIWNYTMPETVRTFEIAVGGATLSALDSGRNVRVWDTETRRPVFEQIATESFVTDIKYLNPDILLMDSYSGIIAVDVTAGKVVWEKKYLEEYNYCGSEYQRIDDDAFLITSSKGDIYKLESRTGKILDKYSWVDDDKAIFTSIEKLRVSPDGKRIAFFSKIKDSDNKALCLCNLTDKSFMIMDMMYENIADPGDFIQDLAWAGDKNLAVSLGTEDRRTNYGYLNMDVLSIDTSKIICLNAADLSEKWRAAFEYTDLSMNRGFLSLEDKNAIVYYEANICKAWNVNTGKEIFSHNINEPIINIQKAQSAEYPNYYTISGKMGSETLEDGPDVVSVMDYFANDLDRVITSKGVYVHQRKSKEIIYYGIAVCDDDFERCEDAPAFPQSPSRYLVKGDYMATVINDKDGVNVYNYDAAGKKFLSKVQVSDSRDEYYKFYISGIEDENVYLTEVSDHKLMLFEINANTGELKKTVLDNGYSTSSNSELAKVSGGKLVYVGEDDKNRSRVFLYDIKEKTSVSFSVGESSYYNCNALEYSSKLGIIFAAENVDNLITVKNAKSTVVTRPEGWGETEHVWLDEDDKKIIVSNNKEVMVCDLDGYEIYRVQCPEVAPCYAQFFGSYFLVQYENGFLYRYDSKDGEYIGKTDTTYASTLNPEVYFTYDKEKNLLYIQNGYILDIIDMNSWIELAYIYTCYGYHAGTDTFMAEWRENNEYFMGYFRHYSLEELIEKGNKIIEGAEISDDLKETYGIG